MMYIAVNLNVTVFFFCSLSFSLPLSSECLIQLSCWRWSEHSCEWKQNGIWFWISHHFYITLDFRMDKIYFTGQGHRCIKCRSTKCHHHFDRRSRCRAQWHGKQKIISKSLSKIHWNSQIFPFFRQIFPETCDFNQKFMHFQTPMQRTQKLLASKGATFINAVSI